MADNKSKSFGVNPFDDDANSAKAKHFSDDEGSNVGDSPRKKEKKPKVSRVVDEDLVDDQTEVQHKTKKKIKGYKSDVKEYVSKVASKGQRSELKDSLAEEGTFADKDVSVKKKRKRKRRKKVSGSEEVNENSGGTMPSVGAVPAPESSEFVESGFVPEVSEGIIEELEPDGQIVDQAMPEEVVPAKTTFPEEEPVVEESIVPEPEESVSTVEAVVEPVEEPVVSKKETFNPFGAENVEEPVVSENVVPKVEDESNPFATSEEKKEEVIPINPFAESSQNTWDEPKWRNFSEDENVVKKDEPVGDFTDNMPKESSQAIEPEIVETRTVYEEPKIVTKEPIAVPQETKSVLKESTTPIDIVSDLHDRDGFFYMLEQAGITKGKIFGIAALFVFVLLGIVGAFFIPFGNIFEGLGGSDNAEKNQQKEQPKKIEKKDVEKESTSSVQNGADVLNMSEILGNEYDYLVLGNDKIAGAFFALRLGGEFVSSEHRFSYYMRHLTEMQNLYATDVYKLLDQSYDRRATLTDFLNTMKVSIETGKQIYGEAAKAASNLNAADISANNQKDIFEQEFFTDIKDLRGQDSFTNLEKFVGFSQNAVRLRSYYKAYNYISQMYLNSLKKIEPRYHDIFVNFDALVKGVHVFDVIGSDINAIIRLSQ